MCGRARLPEDVSEIKLDLRIEWDKLGDYRPRWNAPPTTDMPVVLSEAGRRTLTQMRWGLVPHWAKDIKAGRTTFNARAENIDTASFFRSSWRSGRRCLVVASIYYEWRAHDRQPFAIGLANRGPMIFAGLWDCWIAPDKTELRSFAIVTTAANSLLGRIHDRMPVLLPPADWPAWLGEGPASPEALKAMLKPAPSEGMTMWPVDKRVGNVRNDTPDLWDPIGPEERG
jgi:putative SOS response-associated peptidase YedK